MNGVATPDSDFISINDTVALVAMKMVIKGDKRRDEDTIKLALKIMEVFEDAPSIDMARSEFIEEFGE